MGIATNSPQLNLPRTIVTISTPGKKRVVIEAQVALTLAQQAKGLMFRRTLPQDEGMLFIYDNERELGFYMANCYLPLDMIFLDRDRKVVGIIKEAVPMDRTIRSIGRPAQYVLEVNGGFTSRHGIGVGTEISWRAWRP